MQFHIRCKEGDVGRYVFLPGDPGRCEAIAKHFDNPVHIGMNREYNVWTGYLLGEKVTACSISSCKIFPTASASSTGTSNTSSSWICMVMKALKRFWNTNPI